MQSDVENWETNTDDMADTLGISSRRLQQLESEGWIVGKVGRNRWNVSKTIQSYLMHTTLSAIYS